MEDEELITTTAWRRHHMENILRVTGPLWEFTGHQWITLKKTSDTERTDNSWNMTTKVSLRITIFRALCALTCQHLLCGTSVALFTNMFNLKIPA